MTIRVRNISEKKINAIALQILFPSATNKDGHGTILMHGKAAGAKVVTGDDAPVMPGEYLDLRMSEEGNLLLEKYLAARDLTDEINTVEIYWVRAHFSDGQIWLGSSLNRNAPGPDK